MRIDGFCIPERPILPPLFFCALGLWAACAAVYSCLNAASLQLCLLIVLGSAIASVAVCIAVLKRGISSATIFTLGLCLGSTCAGQAAFAMLTNTATVQDAGATLYVFQIVEEVQTSEYGSYSLARATNEAGQSYLVRVNLSSESTAHCWDVFQASCLIKKPSSNAAEYYWRKACVGSVSPYNPHLRRPEGVLGLISKLREKALASYKGNDTEGSLILQSISFGERSALFNNSFYNTVKRCGLAHMVAVSGAHLCIAVASLAILLRVLRVPRSAAVLLQIMFCVLYVLFTGASHSALRACMMMSCLLFSYFGKRSAFSINALSLCVITFLVLQPRLCFSTPLLLSALATCGIILFSDYFASWLLVFANGHLKQVVGILGMTFAAILSTLPFTCAIFGQVSLVAPLANLLVSPLFGFLCVCGMVATLPQVFVPGFDLCSQFMLEISQLFCTMLKFLAQIPYAATAVSVPLWFSSILGICGVVLLLHFWPPPNKKVFLNVCACIGGLVLSFLFVFPYTHADEIIMLDVGQGDAFVVRSAEQCLLIDTGDDDTAVLQGLARHDVHHLDAVLITHPDADHCAALPSVLDFIEVDRVLVAHDMFECACSNCSSLLHIVASCDVIGLKKGDFFSWGNFQARVLSPENYTDEGGNVDSLVLYITADCDQDNAADVAALFCGDAESEVLSKLDAAGELPQVDIYKVGHHGSAGACTPEQLCILNPKVALISAGAHNRYGHPTEEVLEVLKSAHVAIYRTDQSGDVICKLKSKALNVECVK